MQRLLEQSWQNRNTNPDSCIYYADEALKLISRNNYSNYYSQALNYKGLGYRTKVDYDKSLDLFKQALVSAVEQDDSIQMAYSHNNIGGIYRLKSAYFQAIKHILQARSIFLALDDSEGIGFCDINLGVLYRYQQNYKQSSDFLRSVIAYRQSVKDERGLATAYSLLAENLYLEAKYDSSLVYFERAKELYMDQTSYFEKAANLNGIAGVLFELGRVDSAYSLRHEALGFAMKSDNTDQVIRSHIGLAKIYETWKSYNEADSHLMTALSLSSSYGLENRTVEALKNLATLKASEGQYEDAYLALANYQKTYDTIFNRDKNLQIEELRALHETNYKEQVISEQGKQINKQKRRERTGLISLALVILLLLILGFFFRNQRKFLKVIKLENEVIEEQTKILSQLNSTKDQFFTMIAHDLRSPFQSLLGLSDILASDSGQMSPQEIQDFAQKLKKSSESAYKLLENLLLWAKSQLGRLEIKYEMVMLKQTIDDTLVLFDDLIDQKKLNIQVNVSADDQLVTDHNILFTAFRNLINNAVKFTPLEGSIEISSKRADGKCIITVTDSGIGITQENLEAILAGQAQKTGTESVSNSGTGLGLLISQNFVKLLGGEITASSVPGSGSSFSIHLPC